jgi:hypothetical protein
VKGLWKGYYGRWEGVGGFYIDDVYLVFIVYFVTVLFYMNCFYALCSSFSSSSSIYMTFSFFLLR